MGVASVWCHKNEFIFLLKLQLQCIWNFSELLYLSQRVFVQMYTIVWAMSFMNQATVVQHENMDILLSVQYKVTFLWKEGNKLKDVKLPGCHNHCINLRQQKRQLHAIRVLDPAEWNLPVILKLCQLFRSRNSMKVCVRECMRVLSWDWIILVSDYLLRIY